MKKRILPLALALLLSVIPAQNPNTALAVNGIEMILLEENYEIESFSDGVATVYNSSWQCGVIDKAGNLIIPFGLYDGISSFSDGVAAVYTVNDSSYQDGVIDKAGKLIVPFGLYDDIWPFSNGVAVVYNDGQRGVIDKAGKMIIPFGLYNSISSFSDGVATVTNSEGQDGVIDKAGNLIIPFGLYGTIFEFSDGVAVVRDSDRQYGVIDKAGKLIVPFGLYYHISSFSDGVAAVYAVYDSSYQCGVIDKAGKLIVPFGLYYNIYLDSFYDGVKSVYNSDGQRGVIDKAGKLIIPFGLYYSIGNFSDGMAVVTTNSWQYGVIDKAGKLIVPFELYYGITLYSGGIAKVYIGTWDGDTDEFVGDVGLIDLSSYTSDQHPDPLDAPSEWAIPVINTAIEIGYLTPALQGGYQYNITRGEFCALAVSLIETLTGQTMEVGTRTFADDGGDLNIRKMAHLTIINGYNDTTFGTNDPITRQDAAMILDRIARREQALNKELFEADVTFTDMHLVTSENTAAAIRKMSYSSPRIMAGEPDGRFRPLDNISRQETISTLNKLAEWVGK
ncbi:MAG: WG repeat-containing protein [Oscillospiraceae bacterium]|nr:WG repeat-containing protein [Oscillospiraceae bacterium]